MTGGDVLWCLGDLNFGRARPSTTLDPSHPRRLGRAAVRLADGRVGSAGAVAARVRRSGYNRRWWPIYGAADVTDNVLTSAADYTSFSVIAPTDSRLPNGGGYVIPGIYNITPARRCVVRKTSRRAPTIFGEYTRYWDGVDITVQATVRNGLTVQGGTSSGRVVEDICDVRQRFPSFRLMTAFWRARPIHGAGRSSRAVRRSRVWPATSVPKIDVQLAGTFSSRPGVSLTANQVYISAQVANPAFSTLGRPLAVVPSVTVNLVEPNTMFGDRIDQLDFRIGKILRFGRTRTTLNLDIVNALNSNDNLAYSPTFSPTWPVPTSVHHCRLFRLSAQVDF